MPTQEKTSTSNASVPEWLKNHQNAALNEGKRLYGEGGPEYFPYMTVAPQNQYQTQYMDAASQGAAGKLDPVFENVRSKIMPAVDTAYSRGGRRPTGAGSYGATAADALTNAYAPIAQQQYNTDLDRLYQSGKDFNQYQQAQIQDQVNRFNYYENRPWDQLSRYQSVVQGTNPGQTSTSPYYYNPFQPYAQAGSAALQALPYLFRN